LPDATAWYQDYVSLALTGKGHVGSWHDSDEPIIGQQKEFQRQFKAVLAITLANPD
jgi:alpha-glucosidase (family GH31 glycosyl hydrolase)